MGANKALITNPTPNFQRLITAAELKAGIQTGYSIVPDIVGRHLYLAILLEYTYNGIAYTGPSLEIRQDNGLGTGQVIATLNAELVITAADSDMMVVPGPTTGIWRRLLPNKGFILKTTTAADYANGAGTGDNGTLLVKSWCVTEPRGEH